LRQKCCGCRWTTHTPAVQILQDDNAGLDSGLFARARVIQGKLHWYAFGITGSSSRLDFLDEILTIGWTGAGDFDVVQAETIPFAIRALTCFDAEFGDQSGIEAACRLVCAILVATVLVLSILIPITWTRSVLVLVFASVTGKRAVMVDVSGSLVG
jgi:hypothetical protein